MRRWYLRIASYLPPVLPPPPSPKGVGIHLSEKTHPRAHLWAGGMSPQEPGSIMLCLQCCRSWLCMDCLPLFPKRQLWWRQGEREMFLCPHA